MKIFITILFTCILLELGAQNRYIASTVNVKEKQNKPAEAIPKNLIKAFANGDITAYYPRNPDYEIPLVQFYKHFGMAAKAATVINQEAPFWFCRKPKGPVPDQFILDCMSDKFQIIEEVSRNRITYQDEKKIKFVKTVYSGRCSADGIEKDGPIFKMSDLRKLRDRQYKVVNYQNTSVSYSIEEYLKLRLFRAE